MEYAKTTWVDRLVERPKTYMATTNSDGSVTLTDAPGEVYNDGTPLNASNLNNMETGIKNVHDYVGTDVALSGTVASNVVKHRTAIGVLQTAITNLNDNLSTIEHTVINTALYSADYIESIGIVVNKNNCFVVVDGFVKLSSIVLGDSFTIAKLPYKPYLLNVTVTAIVDVGGVTICRVDTTTGFFFINTSNLTGTPTIRFNFSYMTND